MLDKDVLTQLKRECGGLQTLLRNWPQVFHGVCVCVRHFLKKNLPLEGIPHCMATGNYYFKEKGGPPDATHASKNWLSKQTRS